jgi:hypothetical protein
VDLFGLDFGGNCGGGAGHGHGQIGYNFLASVLSWYIFFFLSCWHWDLWLSEVC